jgi:sulfoxide reductase heme-binding subunit YedZ
MSSTRWRSRRIPRFVVTGLHRNFTLLAVAFVVVHVITTVVDKFAPIGYQDALLPFASPYRPVWLGLGAVAFDLLLALIATSLLRSRIGLRTWRAVHWLAYASWPIALVHTLGTGSDARTGWLAVLSIGCTAAVILAVLWRISTAAVARERRTAFAVASFAVPLAILVWAVDGPLSRGWALRAGTPKALLASFRVSAQRGAVATGSTAQASGAQLPTGSFDATLRGRIRQASAGGGLVVVRIEGEANGGFHGRVYVALRGEPTGGGGVQMVDSSVGLLPQGASAWSPGQVVGLQGDRIFAEVAVTADRHVRVQLNLSISQSGSVTGSLHGSAGGGPAA